mgnify:CR=1 FL=1
MRFGSSLFLQLYLSILAALFIIGCVFVGVTGYVDYQSDYEDFYIDTELAAQSLVKQWREEHKIDVALIQQVSDEYFFVVSLIDDTDFRQYIDSVDVITQKGNVTIFSAEEEGYISARPLQSSQQWLILSDMAPDRDQQDLSPEASIHWAREQREEYITMHIIRGSMAALLLLIAGIMILMVNRIGRHIDELVDSSVAWSKGDFAAKANESLPSPLDKLAAGFNHMANNLDQYAKEQQVMMNAVSHELRTPLSKIQLALEMLQRQQPEVKDNPLVGDLLRYNEELEQLVNQTLTFSKLQHEAPVIDNTQLDLSGLLLERVVELKLAHKDKVVDLDVHAHVGFTGDIIHFQMVFDNVIKNALKYADDRVCIRLIKQEAGIVFCVEDDGPGIPANSREKILMPFYRIDKSRNQQSGGFGLGLAIVDIVARRYQAKIKLSDSQLGGLAFEVAFVYDPPI